MSIYTFFSLEEQKRIILRNATQRLNDIANVLLVKYRSRSDESSLNDETKTSSEVIAVIVDLMISEKRLEYKHLPVKINLDIDSETRAAFAKIAVADFKRVISNIINNAVEAMNQKGEVAIRVFASDTTVNIDISDSGVGMPPELIAKVFDGSIKTSKKEGSAIGLVSSYHLIQSWGGDLRISSQPNEGTTIHISLILLNPEPWFADHLDFIQSSQVVILDDDQSIHDLWESRFSCEVASAKLRLKHFFQADELIKTDKTDIASAYFLCDYELIGQNKTGLDVIEAMNLAESAILVTSRYDERDVRERCEKLNIKILPKNYAPYVPIQIKPVEFTQPDLVLIDDDELVISTWRFMAKKKGKMLLAFKCFSDAERAMGRFLRDTPIYIDSDLGTNVSGEACAKILYERGFTELYLATGHPVSHFEPMYWIKSIVGKESPF